MRISKSIWRPFALYSLLIVASLSCIPQTTFSQHNTLRFRQYLIKDGLNNSNVNNVFQDEKGFLWISTENGLNRFDGNTFINFNHVDFVGTYPIKDINQGTDGRLWLLIQSRIVFLDPETHSSQVCTDSLAQLDEIKVLFRDSENAMWLGMKGGHLVKFSPMSQDFSHISLGSKGAAKPIIYSIQEDADGQIWLGTNKGLWKYNPSEPNVQARLTHYSHNPANPQSISGDIPWVISIAQDGSVWIGSWDKGIDHFYPSSGTSVHYGPREGINTKSIRSIFCDSQGNVWAGSNDQGLFVLPKGGKKFKQYAYLGTSYIESFYEDRSGGIWVATYAGGLRHYSRYREKFAHIKQEENNPNSLNHNLVFGILETHLAGRKHVWIGTHGGGLNQMIEDPHSGNPRYFLHTFDPENPQSIIGDVVLNLKEDRQGNVWISSFSGLCMFTKQAQIDFLSGKSPAKFHRFGVKDGIHPGPAWALLFDRKDNLWVATTGGVYRLGLGASTFEFIPYRNLLTRALIETQTGEILLGTKKGLFSIDPSRKNLVIEERWVDTTGVDIVSLFEDQKGRLWMGSEGRGLFVQSKDGAIHQFDQGKGLPGNVIEGIMQDTLERFWISSNQGLSVFYPDSLLKHRKNLQTYVRNYDVLDGLQENEFSEGAFFQSHEGTMYFGGINGITVFDPLTIRDNPNPPAAYLTGLRILDRDIHVGDKSENGQVLLHKDICTLEKLAFSYKDYGFTFFYAGLDFSAPEKNQYAHYLEGFEKNWVYDGPKNFATYTNLDPGTYTFHVKASNNDQTWGTESQSVQILISPPPWKSWWAYTLYFVLLSTGIIGYFRFKIREKEKEFQTLQRIEKAKADERERVRKNTAADFHDELGNKMTKIALFSELAKRSSQDPDMLQVYLNHVEDNTRLLSDGVRDFIWVLDPEKDSLYETLLRLKEFGDQLYEHSDIRFEATGIQEGMDERKIPLETRRELVMVCKEAMNNALKYSGAKKVLFAVKLQDNTLHLSLQDDGKGFEKEVTSQGYGLENMKKRAHKMGTTLGIESTIGAGTQIQLAIELPHMGD